MAKDSGAVGADPRITPFVVIGASAGGVDALQALVATLPAGLPAPLVIAQHLDPTRPSHLGEILAARTALPVRVLTDHPTLPLEPGTIFVVPSNRHVRVSGHELAVEADGAGRPKPSIDRLLADAAAVFGEGAIAVILTGRGTDGAAGARAVKAAGGTVMIQDPATASYPAMPRAVDPTVVDIVAELEQIGPLLRVLLNGETLPVTRPRERALHTFLDELRERSGIDFGLYKMPTIRRRLQRRLAAVGAQGLDAYQHYLQGHPEEYERLVNSFLIKVTEFFRDPELYAYLREQVVPDLIAQARQHGNVLRVWSAGCATGQEAYSLAILIAEALGDELDQFEVRLFATDLDAAAVAVARHGVYPPGDLASVPPALVARYFTRVEGGYAVSTRIRALTVFGEHDLGQRPPFPRIDLCVCRNVLIYFTPELQAHALRLFAFALRDGGYLVLGKSETSRPLDDLFAPVAPALKVYRRQGERLTLAGTTVPLSRAPGRPYPASPSTPTRRRRLAAGPAPLSPQEGQARGLLALPVGVAVVDRRYDIRVINNAARRLLGIHREAVGEDLIHLARGLDGTALRATIDAAFHHDAPRSEDAILPGTPREDRIMAARTAGGEERYLQVACYPHTTDATEGQAGRRGHDTVLLVMLDVTRAESERRALAEAQARAEAERAAEVGGYRDELARSEERRRAETAELTARVERLAAAERDLLAANMEMGAANAELRGRHEDAQLRAEEAQAAIEEVETLNEELQASNEELETLNEELQATVEELHTTNGELRARGLELEAQAAALQTQRDATETQRHAAEAERARLEAVLAEMADAVLVVDPQGQTVLANAAYERLVGPAGTLATQDAEGQPLPPEATPKARAARGEAFSMAFMAPDAAGNRRWYEANGRQVQREGAPRWGVVVIRDITERTLRRLQDEFLTLASHELRTPLTPIQAYLDMLKKLLQAEGDGLAGHERRWRYTTLAREQVERLKGLIDDLLDVGRLQGGKLSVELAPLDLTPVIARAVEAVRPEAAAQEQEIVLDAPASPLRVRGDARRLDQITLNLLTNAVKYAPASPRIAVRLARADGHAILEVQDHGPGISAEALPHLFERFYQVEHVGPSRRGLGLGLFITRELVGAHDGTIEVRSTDDGTTFTVRLPLLDDKGKGTGT